MPLLPTAILNGFQVANSSVGSNLWARGSARTVSSRSLTKDSTQFEFFFGPQLQCAASKYVSWFLSWIVKRK